MKDFDLPALEYCSLDRASRLLGCELGDLLHWAELSAIPLMIKFTHKVSSDARIMFSDNIDLYKCLRDIDPEMVIFMCLNSVHSLFHLMIMKTMNLKKPLILYIT